MSNNLALMDVLFAGARQRVLAILLLRPEESFYLRELARMTHSHAGTLARELDKLTEAGLLVRTELGNQVRYQANRACPLFEDLAALFRKTHGAAAAVREALAPLADRIDVAVIFGSMATASHTPRSDIDVLVVGAVDFAALVQALYPAQQALQREINPVLYSTEEFRKRSRRDEAFVREVTGKPMVFLIGDKHDLAELAGDPAPAVARR